MYRVNCEGGTATPASAAAASRESVYDELAAADERCTGTNAKASHGFELSQVYEITFVPVMLPLKHMSQQLLTRS